MGRKQLACFLAGVAGLALTTASIAQGVGVKGTGVPVPKAATLGEQPDAVAQLPVSQITPAANTILARLNVAQAGLYSLRAPANSGIQIFVDGSLALDASGFRTDTTVSEVTGLLSLKPGARLIEVRGISADHPDWFRVTLAESGADPAPMALAAERIDAQTAAKMLQDQAIATGSDAGMGTDVGMVTETRMGSGMGNDMIAAPGSVQVASATVRPFTPFVVGGNSSVAGKASRTGGNTGDRGADNMASGMPPGLSGGFSSRTERPSPFVRQEVIAGFPTTGNFGSGMGGTSSPPTAAPGTSDPGTSEPITSAPGTSAPRTPDPGTSAPGTPAPGTSAPGTSTPGTSAPGTSTPGTSDPVTSAPRTPDPGTSAPGTSAPGTSTPGTSTPGTSDPGTSAPRTPDPGTSDPGTSAPGTSTPGTSTPGTSDPGTSDPAPAPAPPPAPVARPIGDASITPLSPPANVVLTSGLQLTSVSEDTAVANTGTTLFGAVMDNSMFDMVNVAIAPGNRTTSVDVGPTTGQFAVRLFAEDFAAGPNITVTLTGASSASDEVTSQPVSYELTGLPVQDGVTQALSRLTFGPTPELYASIRATGFTAFVEQQLSPETIADTAFLAMDPYSLLHSAGQYTDPVLNGVMSHDAAYAIFSERQLREVMGRFWANHFHAVTKDTEIRQSNMHDRAFFRANAFGKFEDLLLYSARSPLMSQFLDNDLNRRNGLNMNYAREILELHTVGVNAGYTTEDIREVAKVFTGWSYVQTNPGVEVGVARQWEFLFRSSSHDTTNKTISFLNMTIPGRTGEAGVDEGEELIAALADNINTRNFVCGKIVQLLVADTPPADFVASCVMAWESSDGDTGEILRAILLDPAYITTVEYQRNKAKTPFEYAVSIARALGAVPSGAQVENFYRDMRDIIRTAGGDYLRFQVPTGLPEVAAAWTSSATMINAYNEAMDITERRHLYGIDLGADIRDAGLETAEEVAAYLLTIGTADRFRQEEFDAIVSVLKGPDGIFEPRVTDETLPLERAMGVLMVTPSFQLQ